jgi:HEAT repeat protein
VYGFAANLELGQLAICIAGNWDDPNSRVTVVDASISNGVYPVFSSPYGRVTFRPPTSCAERKPPDAFWDRERQLSAAIRCSDKAVAGALAITEAEHTRLKLVTTGSELLHTELEEWAQLPHDELVPHVQRLLTLELGGDGLDPPHTWVSAAVELMLDKLPRNALAPHANLIVTGLKHVHPSARRRALVRLAALGSELLGKHVPEVVGMLTDAVGSVRAAAIDALGCLDEPSQRQHVGSVAALLTESMACAARHAALLALDAIKAMEADAQGQPKGLANLDLVVERLADSAPFVCLAAAALFKKAAGTAEHAAQVVAHLQHAEVGVRLAALDALSSLEPAVIAEHALVKLVALVGAVKYDEATGGEAFELLKQMAPAALEAHTQAITGWLKHEDGSIPAAKRCRLTLELLAPKLEPASLARMGASLVKLLEDNDPDIQNAAVLALGSLDLEALGAECVGKLVQVLTHKTSCMRMCAIKVLQKLGPALSKHAEPLLRLVDTTTGAVQSSAVRFAALEAMASFEPEALVQYANQWVHCLNDTDQAARAASLRLLAKLEPSALAKHAANLVAQISETPQMLVGVLQRLEPSELAEHATGLTKHLKHDKREVRAAALSLMSRLSPKVLERYAEDIIKAIEDPEDEVRQAAKYALGKLESEALERHADTFIAKLDNEKAAIRVSALGTLVKFKPAALKVAAPVPPLCALSL